MAREGNVLSRCVGFVDGTNRECCQPRFNQSAYYSGHKVYHSFKFQSVVTPDGLISHLFGPVVGLRHDQYVYSISGVEQIMDSGLFSSLCSYVDQGSYVTNGHLWWQYTFAC
jgi:hypothetical protein